MRTAHRIASADHGVELAAWEAGPRDAPTIVLVHGYPDSHHVWDGVVTALEDRFHVVTYDVRGAGASSRPNATSDYALEHLSSDLATIARTFGRGRPVHVASHDWGSIQSWEALADERHRELFASFTSISGPCLDHVGHWVRSGLLADPTKIPAALRQGLASWYIAAFHAPGIDRVLPRAFATLGPRVGLVASGTTAQDSVTGVSMYRANVSQRLRAPQRRHIPVPVQLVVPRDDAYVTPVLAHAAVPWVSRLYRRDVDGSHWSVRNEPDAFVGAITSFVDSVQSGDLFPIAHFAWPPSRRKTS